MITSQTKNPYSKFNIGHFIIKIHLKPTISRDILYWKFKFYNIDKALLTVL